MKKIILDFLIWQENNEEIISQSDSNEEIFKQYEDVIKAIQALNPQKEILLSSLVALVNCTKPDESIFDHPLVAPWGRYNETFCRWDWGINHLEALTKPELWELYILCLNSTGEYIVGRDTSLDRN